MSAFAQHCVRATIIEETTGPGVAASPPFEQRIHLADLDLVRTSRAAACALPENYVGLPFD